MGILRLSIAGLLVMSAWAQQGSKPIKGIDIIVKKQPSGSATLVKTDANGRFSVRIPEAGTYSLRFAAPPDLPGLPGTVRVTFAAQEASGAQVSVRKPSVSRHLDVKGTGSGTRLLPVAQDGLYAYQTLEFSGPGFFHGNATADRMLTSTEALSFVAVEDQLSPLAQSVAVIAEGYDSFQYTAALGAGIERRWRTQLQAASGTWNGAGEKPEFRVAINTEGLPEGTYSDELLLSLRFEDVIEEVRIPVTIHIRPRGFDLGIVTDRKLRVIAERTGLVRTIVRITNQTTAEEVHTLGLEEESDRNILTLPSAPIRVASGQTVEVPIIVDVAALRRKATPTVKSISNIKPLKFFEFVAAPLPSDPASTPCVATELVPILINRPNNVLRAVPANLEFEVWNNCGAQLTDFTLQAISKLGGSSAGKAVNKPGIMTGISIPTAGSDTVQVEVRSGDLSGEATFDLEVEATPVPAMKAVNKGGIGSLARPEPANNQSIAPGTIVEVETTPVSEAGELLFGRIPIRVLSRQGNTFTFRVPYATDPTIPHTLQIRDGNHTSAPLLLPIAPAAPVILRNLESGAYSFLRADDGSLTPVTSETRAPAGSTLVVFAEGLGSVEQEPTAENPTVVLSSATRKIKAGINDGVKGQTIGLGKNPPGGTIKPTQIALTRDLPIELEGNPTSAFRITFTLPDGLESVDPASGVVALWLESQGVMSELASTFTPTPVPLTAVQVQTRAIPAPATHLLDTVSQTGPNTFTSSSGNAHTLEAPTPQSFPTKPGERLTLSDFVSSVGIPGPSGTTTWPFTVPLSAFPVNFTAVYEKAFKLTVTMLDSACGTVGTGPLGSPDGFWSENSTVPLTRSINPGWTFTNWTSAATGNSVKMTGPKTVYGVCRKGYPVTLELSPKPDGPAFVQISGGPLEQWRSTVVMDGGGLLIPQSFSHLLNHYVFLPSSSSLTWNYQNPNYATVIPPPPAPGMTIIPTYFPTCRVYSDEDAALLTGASLYTAFGAPAKCYTIGSTVMLRATAPAGQVFLQWSDGDKTNPRAFVIPVATLVNQKLPTPVFGTATNACVSAPAGPGAWWSMESATPPVRDRWPLGLHAVASSGALPTVIPGGKVGNALQFNGTNQSLAVPNHPVFDSLQAGPGDGFTVDAWVKLEVPLNPTPSQKSGGTLFSNTRLAGLGGYRVIIDRVNGPGLYLGAYRNTNGYETFYGPLPIADTNWHFVAVRLKRLPVAGDTELTFWVDGIKKTVVPAGKVMDLTTKFDYYLGCATLPALCWNNPSVQTPLPIAIGKGDGTSTDPNYHFPGAIDELEYFQRALSDAEIASIYNAGSAGKCPPAGVRITVNTNPATVNATVGATGLGSSSPAFTTVLPAGTTSLAVTAQSPVVNQPGTSRFVLRTINPWSVNGTANPNYSTSPQPVPVPTADTTYTANYDTQHQVTVVINGTCTVTPATGFYNAGLQLPVTITPPTGATATWAFTGGTLNVVSGGRIPILSPGTLTVNCTGTTGQSITVNTNPANIGATVGVDTVGSNTNTYSTTLPPNSTQTLTAQDPVLSAGTLYSFDNWTPAGATVQLPPSGSSTYTANYRVRGYVVTITGCASTIGPISLSVSTNPLVFAPNAALQLFPNPPAGQTFTSFTITMGGVTTTQTTNPGRITLTGPATIVANCGTPATVPVTLVTNPANIGATLSLAGVTPGSGSALNQYTSAAIPGATGTATSSPVQIFNGANNIRWDFKNWTGGTTNPHPVTIQPTATTFTANYDTFYKIDVVNNGCTSVTPAPGFYAAGSSVTVGATAASGSQVSSVTFGQPLAGATPAPIQNNSLMAVDTPKVLIATCGAIPTGGVTVNTNPANLGVTVGVTGAGSALNGFTAPALPAGPIAVTANPAGPLLTAQGVQYQLQRWRQAGTTLGSAASQAGTVVAGVTTVYTADYTITGNRVTLINNGCASIGTTPALPANGIWPVNTPLTALAATPPTGGKLTNVVAAILDPSNGQTTNLTFTTLPIPNPLPINTPWTFTFTCAAAATVSVTVNTSPANLGASVGVGAAVATNTFTAALPAGSAQTLSGPPTYIVSTTGIGYRLTSWTPGGPNVTLPATGSVTYTANYTPACSLVLTEVQPTGTGTITLSPAGLAGFSAPCYTTGAAITATLVPIAGRVVSGFLPFNGGSGQNGPGPYSFSLIGPMVLTGTTRVGP